MRIAVKGRNTPVSDGLREHVEKRFRKIARQVSELAELELELSEERNPAIADREIAEATLYLKGVTLRARAAATDMNHAINVLRGAARAAGQAPPRAAPQAARDARRAAGRERPRREAARAVA